MSYRFPASLADACRPFLAPQPEETVETWLGKSINLTRGTDSPGWVSLQSYPYARRIVELAKSKTPTQVTLCFASQTAKTTAMLFAAAYRARLMPADTLFAIANQTMATGYSTRRWLPMLWDSPVMREIFPPDKRRVSGPVQRFLTHNMLWVGSHSEANLKGNPCRDLFGDEIDTWAGATEASDSALEGFLQRNKAYAGSFTMLSSTPTTVNGAVWKLLLSGSNERFHCPCLHCGHQQEWKWERVRWAPEAKENDGRWNVAKVEETARLFCEKCDGPHSNTERLQTLQGGEWVATNPQASRGELSFHLSGLYSPHPKSSLANLAGKFCKAMNTRNMDLLQAFITGDLAEPWSPALHADGTALEQVTGDYDLGEPWPLGRWLTSTWDVQQDRMEGEVRQWADNSDSRLVWEGVCHTWEEVHAVCEAWSVPAQHVGIDSGYTPQVVYDACARWGWTPMKGEGRGCYLATDSVTGEPVKVVHRESLVAMSDRRSIPLLLWSSQHAQDLLAFLLSGNGPSYTRARNVSERYVTQMKSHAKIDRGGRWAWENVAKRDEAWDIATMGVVIATRLEILTPSQLPKP